LHPHFRLWRPAGFCYHITPLEGIYIIPQMPASLHLFEFFSTRFARNPALSPLGRTILPLTVAGSLARPREGVMSRTAALLTPLVTVSLHLDFLCRMVSRRSWSMPRLSFHHSTGLSLCFHHTRIPVLMRSEISFLSTSNKSLNSGRVLVS